MAKSQRSLIPPDKQIPVMIVSAIIFAGILWWRFAPQRSVADSPLSLVPVSTSTGDGGPIADLNTTLGELASLDKPRTDWPEWRTELVRDPFHWAEPDPATTTPAEGDSEVTAGPQRAELNLRGVLMDAQGGLALINDQYVRAGGSVDGCRVRTVSETSVVVEDSSGTRTLYLPENGPK